MRSSFKPEKMRHEVAVQRFASPLRDAAPRALEAFWHDRHTFDRAVNANWTDMGPANYSGRATCLAAHPANPKVLYAGSAAGGLWKSIDGGDSWQSCWPHSLSQNIGAVAIDPGNSERLVCATGEGNLSTASYPGSGIFISEDCGFSWLSFIWLPGKRRMDADDRDTMPRRVASISFSAPDPSMGGERRVAFGSISNDPELPGGLFAQDDSGALEWVDVWSQRPYNCYSAVYHPTEPRTLFAAIEVGGSLNGIWKTSDAGRQWVQLGEGLPSGELCGRISLAISTKNPDILWALVATRSRKVLGVFRSLDGGRTWKNQAGRSFDNEKQLAFNSTIAIHPEDPRIVVVGAQALHRTRNAGHRWSPIGSSSRALSSRELNPQYVHPDHHALLLPGGNLLYSANDGGVARSRDLGRTWDQIGSPGMNTVLFYAIDVSPVNANIIGGGAQDNGTLLAGVNPGRGVRRKPSPDFVEVLAGDGGFLLCDPRQPELVFASSFSTETHRHDPGRPWTHGYVKARWSNASPPVPKSEQEVLGLTVMAIKPRSRRGGPRELLLGTNRLWRSQNDGRSWRAERFHFDGSAVTAIEVSTADPAVVYVGTAHGGIYRSGDGGREWSADLAGPEIPNRTITQLECDPRDANHVVAVVAATGRPSAILRGEPKPFSRVFASTTGGQVWNDIDEGKLPNVVFHALAWETHPPFRVFAAGDAGPWVRETDGAWVSLAGDMPCAVISDLIYHHKTRTLTAGTYGRGIWRMAVPEKFEIVRGVNEPGVDDLLPPVEGLLFDFTLPGPLPIFPENGMKFDNFPRHTSFVCKPMEGATGYVFEVITDHGFAVVKASASPEVEIELSGADGYTWRCWALTKNGGCSVPSALRKFRYLV